MGTLTPGEWVVMRTDWDKRSQDEELFLNDDPDPYEDGSHSPGPTTQCIDYLLSKGSGVGCFRDGCWHGG